MHRGMRIALLALVVAATAYAQETIPLWPGDPPGAARLPRGSETPTPEHVTSVELPDLTYYTPTGVTGAAPAIVVLPGGGYGGLAIEKEGHEVARWLAAHGVAAAVVKYRVAPNDEAGYRYPVPLLDARRALRIVRSRAAGWGLDPSRVGVLGFSAGGHLASLCATAGDQPLTDEPADELAATSARPDFVALIYPVIAMDQPYGHAGSRRRLLGERPDPDLLLRCSTAKQVNERTPPAFLVHAVDDPVSCRNSLAFQAACLEHRVPVACHLFARGGHGFGLRAHGAVRVWSDLLIDWLRETTTATP